jgi:hypothetical protein
MQGCDRARPGIGVPEFRVRPDSLRRCPDYDLASATESGQELAFELTEMTDGAWAAMISTMVSVPYSTNCCVTDRAVTPGPSENAIATETSQ